MNIQMMLMQLGKGMIVSVEIFMLTLIFFMITIMTIRWILLGVIRRMFMNTLIKRERIIF